MHKAVPAFTVFSITFREHQIVSLMHALWGRLKMPPWLKMHSTWQK